MGGMSLIIVLLAGASAGEPPSAPDEWLARAESALQEGLRLRENPRQARPHFLEAMRFYEALYEAGHRNSACLRNEGNAALLAGDLPHAILAYRRGLRLAPNDRALRTNLAFAREQVDYPSPGTLGRAPVDTWPPWLPRLTVGQLLGLAFLLYDVGCALLTRWWMARRLGFLTAGLIALAAATWPAAGVMVARTQDREERLHPLVIIADNGVLLRKGNGLAYPARYETPVNRGVEARLLFERDDWVQIELAGGETGWVRREYVLRDEP